MENKTCDRLVTRAMLDRGLKASDYNRPRKWRYCFRSNITGDYQYRIGYCCEAKSGIDADAVTVFTGDDIDYDEWTPVSTTAWI